MHIKFQVDLCNALGQISDMGGDGAAIYSRDLEKPRKDCNELEEFVDKLFGPFAKKISKFNEKCKRNHCKGCALIQYSFMPASLLKILKFFKIQKFRGQS